MKKIIVFGVVLVVAVVGMVAYSFLKPPKEASGPIEAIPVAVSVDSTEAVPPTPTLEPTAISAVVPTAVDEVATVETVEEQSDAGTSENAGPVVFQIVQADSEARFVINEVLNGAPKIVVGVTDQVAGEIAIFAAEPAKSKIGTILINARTLSTDNDFRNRAIKNRILSTDDHEFVSFTPTELVGLPDDVAIGESFTFQIVGDLSVRDVTRPVTFDATVTPRSETELSGTASTTILYPDFGLAIPEAPRVAGVDDEVRLEIDFVAVAQ